MGKYNVDADEIKNILGEDAKRIILNGTGRVEKKKMISCLSPHHEDRNPSMSWYDKGNCYKCHSCGYTMDIFKYYEEYESMNFMQAMDKLKNMVGISTPNDFKLNVAKKKEYKKPKVQLRELSQKGIDYMAKRGISKKTLDHWKVKESTYWDEPVYVFQYFMNGVLEHVSYRVQRKATEQKHKGGRIAGTKDILWGMDHIDKTKPIVITEGQPDAMCVYESGYKNVVSVPSGASNFNWVENCWEWLKECKEFIVWKDNDSAGNKLESEMKKRFDNVKVIYSQKYKDANEMLLFDGKESVYNLIQEGITKMDVGILDVADMEYVRPYDVDDGIETGFIEYDEHVRDWKKQEITVIFGRDNEGKTTVISQIIAHNIQRGEKIFLYSGEMSNFKIQNWMYRQLVGRNTKYLGNKPTKYDKVVDVKDEAIKKIKEWHRGKFYLFDMHEDKLLTNLDNFFGVMELSVKKYGVSLVVIDNLMSAMVEDGNTINSDQANFVQRCKNLARNNNVHVVLLAHPKKDKLEIHDGIGNLTKNDISGSKNISNKADNIIAIERNWHQGNDIDLVMTSLKDRERGQRKVMHYNFSPNSLRFYNNRTKENVIYGWDDGEAMSIEKTPDIIDEKKIDAIRKYWLDGLKAGSDGLPF